MAILSIVLAIVAAVVAHGTSVGTVAIVNAVLAVWVTGVTANYRRWESDDAPRWPPIVRAVTLLASVAFLVVGLAS